VHHSVCAQRARRVCVFGSRCPGKSFLLVFSGRSSPKPIPGVCVRGWGWGGVWGGGSPPQPITGVSMSENEKAREKAFFTAVDFECVCVCLCMCACVCERQIVLIGLHLFIFARDYLLLCLPPHAHADVPFLGSTAGLFCSVSIRKAAHFYTYIYIHVYSGTT